MHRWVDSIKIAPKGTGCEIMDCIYSAPGVDSWQAILDTVMNLQVP